MYLSPTGIGIGDAPLETPGSNGQLRIQFLAEVPM
jgi:hypothetical protein